MKKMIAVKVSAVLVCIAAGFSGLCAQQAGQIKAAGDVDGAVQPASKPASQPADMSSAEKIAAAEKLLDAVMQNKGFTPDRERQIAELLKKLEDQSFTVREKATEELCKEGNQIAPLVEKAAESDDAEVKSRCEIVLKAIKGKGSTIVDDLNRAVDVLVPAGQTKVVGTLIDLLAHQDVAIRSAAGQYLARLTGESFDYKAADDAEKRQKSLEQWKAWWGKNQATFAFKKPAQTAILVSSSEGKTVKAFSFQGEELWTRTLEDTPNCAVGLPNGNLLVAFSSVPGYAAEYDADGKEVWSTKEFKLDVNEMCAEASRLANGNTLLAFPNDKKVIEITHEGKIVLQVPDVECPHSASLTADGNIMVMEHLGMKISVYDHQGKVLKSFKEDRHAVDAVALPDGHFLVSLLGDNPHLKEYDADGKMVWSRDCPVNITTAVRLPDGNTVLSDGNEGVVIVNPQGEVIKTLVKHNNWGPFIGKIRFISSVLPGKGTTTAPASSRPASGPASGPAS